MIFLFLIPPLIYGIEIYDNTAIMLPLDPQPSQLKPCLSITTEHFSQLNEDNNEGRLSLHSTRLIHEIVAHLLYLMPIVKNINYSDSQELFITYVIF